MDMIIALSGIGSDPPGVCFTQIRAPTTDTIDTPETTVPGVIIPVIRATTSNGKTGEAQTSSERGEATRVNR
jgi:hypothetical protein